MNIRIDEQKNSSMNKKKSSNEQKIVQRNIKNVKKFFF